MGNKKLTTILSVLFIAIFIFSHLYMGLANVSDKRIHHDSPYGFQASDTFSHILYSYNLAERGDNKYLQPYIVADLQDVVAINPPALPHIVVALSTISGLNIYDAQLILVFFIPILASLLIFLIIRRFNLKLAILSAPFTLLAYTEKFLSIYTWGIWTVALSYMFLAGFFYIYSDKRFKDSWIFQAILIAAILEAYAVTVVFPAIFLAINFLINLKEWKENLIRYIKIFSLALVLGSYYIFNFFFATVVKRIGVYAQSSSELNAFGYPIISMGDWSWWIAFIGIGFLFYLLFTKNKKRYDMILGIYAFAFGFLYLLAFGKASLTFRYFWPIFLAVFFGLCLFSLLKLTKMNKIHIVFICSCIFIIFIGAKLTSPPSGQGIMIPQEWESYKWIKENIPEENTMLFFYSDSYTQSAKMMFSQRVVYTITMNTLRPYINNKSIPDTLFLSIVTEGVGDYPYKKSLFEFGHHLEDNKNLLTPSIRLCEFDFIVFNMANYNKAVSEYNVELINHLINQANGTLVWQNSPIFILRNDKMPCDKNI